MYKHNIIYTRGEGKHERGGRRQKYSYINLFDFRQRRPRVNFSLAQQCAAAAAAAVGM